jgi:hypothetical protein
MGFSGQNKDIWGEYGSDRIVWIREKQPQAKLALPACFTSLPAVLEEEGRVYTDPEALRTAMWQKPSLPAVLEE